MNNRNTIFTTILLALGFFALSRTAQAVIPAPDGGYPGLNTAEGQNALFSRTTGVWNTAVGALSLFGDTTGTGNTTVGINGLHNNVRGSFNTAMGLNALYQNTADSNSAFGSYALFANTNGIYNSAFGYRALAMNTASGNTASGYQALSSNTSGVDNTAAGVSALSLNNTGSNNTADGAAALALNSGGIDNTAIGAETLINNTSGSFNTALGFEALGGNDAGGANTAIGYQALLRTTGQNNTAIGNAAGANVRTGSFNVYLGAGLGGVPDEVGHTYISNIASTQQNLSVVTVDLATGLLGHEFSSQRYKEDIKPMDNASEALFALKPVTYRYKKEIDNSQALDYGLVAEEVAKVDPNLAVRDGKGQIESVRHNAVNAMLLNEFLKEHRKVQELEKGMAAVTAQLKEQAAQIQRVSAQVEMNRPTTEVVLNNPQRMGGYKLWPGSPTPAAAAAKEQK